MTSLEEFFGVQTFTLPQGFDPQHSEKFLSDEEFEEMLKCTREEFYAMPMWKQQLKKRQAGLPS